MSKPTVLVAVVFVESVFSKQNKHVGCRIIFSGKTVCRDRHVTVRTRSNTCLKLIARLVSDSLLRDMLMSFDQVTGRNQRFCVLATDSVKYDGKSRWKYSF